MKADGSEASMWISRQRTGIDKPFQQFVNQGLDIMRFVRSLFARRPPQAYRDYPALLHLALLAFYGLQILHFKMEILPEVYNVMGYIDENGVFSFFAGASWLQVVVFIFLSLSLFCFSVFCMIGSLASFDTLKHRLLNFSS
jgi:hypothetical protein